MIPVMGKEARMRSIPTPPRKKLLVWNMRKKQTKTIEPPAKLISLNILLVKAKNLLAAEKQTIFIPSCLKFSSIYS